MVYGPGDLSSRPPWDVLPGTIRRYCDNYHGIPLICTRRWCGPARGVSQIPGGRHIVSPPGRAALRSGALPAVCPRITLRTSGILSEFFTPLIEATTLMHRPPRVRPFCPVSRTTSLLFSCLYIYGRVFGGDVLFPKTIRKF